jgi:hypothetical protein
MRLGFDAAAMVLVLSKPLLQKVDGGDEVPAEGQQHVNIVPVAIAAETVPDRIAVAVFAELWLY